MKKTSNIYTWGTVFVWGTIVLGAWIYYPFFAWMDMHSGVFFPVVLFLQVLAFADIKRIVSLKDKEAVYLLIVLMITIVGLWKTNSSWGAFLTIGNFCAVWYLSDKWKWTTRQLLSMWIVYLVVFARWVFFPKSLDVWNPNTIGSITAFTLFIIVAGLELFWKNKRGRIISQILCLIACGCIIVIYRGRGSLLGLLFFVLLMSIPQKCWRNSFFYRGLCVFLTVGSLLFVWGYTFLWKMIPGNQVMVLNKQLFSGREKIWDELWELFEGHIMTGIGTGVKLQSWPVLNVHNAMYHILVIYGVIVFLLVLIYSIKKMFLMQEKIIGVRYRQCALFGIFAVCFESFTESDLVWVFQMFVWTFLLVIVNSEPEGIGKV